MSRDFPTATGAGAATNYLTLGSAVKADHRATTWMIWMYAHELPTFTTLMSNGEKDSSATRLSMFTNNSNLYCENNPGINPNTAITTGDVLSTNTWHHCAMTVASNGLMTCWIDGANKAEDLTPTVAAISGDEFSIGARMETSAFDYGFNGFLAYATVWDAVLTDREILSLARKTYPTLIRPDKLLFFSPLDGVGSSRDLIGGKTLTETGTVGAAEDPPLAVYPTSPIIGFTAAGAAPAGTRPQNPLGHPFAGPFAGPIG